MSLKFKVKMTARKNKNQFTALMKLIIKWNLKEKTNKNKILFKKALRRNCMHVQHLMMKRILFN